MRGFEEWSAEETYRNFGWGETVTGTVLLREDGAVMTFVGFADEVGKYICEIENDGLAAQAIGDSPTDALVKAYVQYLAPMAVFEEWTQPMMCGLRFGCEDVVNWLAYEGAQAILHGLRSLMCDHEPEVSDELTDKCMNYAIEYVRDNADELGVEFVDVWS